MLGVATAHPPLPRRPGRPKRFAAGRKTRHFMIHKGARKLNGDGQKISQSGVIAFSQADSFMNCPVYSRMPIATISEPPTFMTRSE